MVVRNNNKNEKVQQAHRRTKRPSRRFFSFREKGHRVVRLEVAQPQQATTRGVPNRACLGSVLRAAHNLLDVVVTGTPHSDPLPDQQQIQTSPLFPPFFLTKFASEQDPFLDIPLDSRPGPQKPPDAQQHYCIAKEEPSTPVARNNLYHHVPPSHSTSR